MRVPMMSAGTRSGVNWIRANVPPTTVASVSTASVLATPGTPSSRQWPRASTATSIRSIIRSCPTITFLTSKRVLSSSDASSAGVVSGSAAVVSGSAAVVLAPLSGGAASAGGGDWSDTKSPSPRRVVSTVVQGRHQRRTSCPRGCRQCAHTRPPHRRTLHDPLPMGGEVKVIVSRASALGRREPTERLWRGVAHALARWLRCVPYPSCFPRGSWVLPLRSVSAGFAR